MKTFSKFIYEAYLILEKRGGPSYNYEVALERLYNHLIKGGERSKVRGKQMRLAISKGDMDTITDIIAQELNAAENDPKHPLHFDNAPDEGFTGGKKTNDHRDSYYSNLKDQAFTILNDVQSRTGRSIGARGSIAKREGESKVELSKAGKLLYDKLSDTSKPDMTFTDPVRPERVSKTSLKKASGAVAASSGAEETYGNLGVAIDSAIKRGLKSGKITKDKEDELRFSGMSIAGKIREIMRGSKGKNQSDLLPEVDKLHGELEKILPGVSREIGIEQMSGKGKYGETGGVDRYITTGRGGGTIEDPRQLGITQRARQGKGTTKTKAGPVQRPMAVTADIKKATTGQPSSFSQQEPTPQSVQRQEKIPQLAQNITSRGLQIPKGIRLQHLGNFFRNQAAQQARIQQAQQAAAPQPTNPQQSQPQSQPQSMQQAPQSSTQTQPQDQQSQKKKKNQQPVPATPITQ